MLALLRRKARSPIIQAAIVIIILVFIFWLPQMGDDGGPGTVAVVNDEAITSREFQRRYDDLLVHYRDQFGGVVPAELLETLGIREQVLNQMIRERLLLQSALNTGLPVTGDEIQQTIHEMGEFSQNGYFSLDRYRQTLAAARLSVLEFEAGVHTDLQRHKIVQQLVRFAWVGDDEVRERFHRDHDQVRLSYIRLAGTDFRAGIAPSDEELIAHYQAHAEQYRSEPRVQLDYLLFTPDGDYANGISEEEIAAYYQANQARYDFPEERRARHILIRSAESDPPEIRQNRRQQMEQVLEQVRAGRDFRELARLYSEDATAAEGGDLGFFRRGELLAAIEEAAFKLAPGGISPIVETRLGLHIIKLDEIKPGRRIGLDEVRAEIAQRLQKERGRQLVFGRAGEVYEAILAQGSLARGAEASGVAVKSTGLFERARPPAELARYPEVVTAALALNQGELSSIIAAGDGYAILFATKREEPRVPPLEAIRRQVESDLIDLQARAAARRAAEGALAALHEGGDIGTVAAGIGQRVRESGWFSWATVMAAELPAAVTEAGLRLNEKEPLPEQVQEVEDSFYVIRLAGWRPGGEELFTRWADPIRNELLRAKREALIDSWIKYQLGQAKITITR